MADQPGMGNGSPGNAAAGPSIHRTPAPAMATLAPVRARPDGLGGEDDAEGVIMLPAEPNVFTDKQLDEYKEQDRFLPYRHGQIANVGRIMKNSLPDSAKIAKEAKECVQECVSEFISFLSSEAADKVLIDKRKTINGEDILHSMTILGFDNYEQTCRIYLAKYREYMKEHAARTSREGSPLQEVEEDVDGDNPEGPARKQTGKRARKGEGEGEEAAGSKKRSKGP